MMKTFIRKWMLLAIMLACTSVFLHANDEFVVSEDFSGGLPNGWAITPASGDTKWEHKKEGSNYFFSFDNPSNETNRKESRIETSTFSISELMNPVLIFSYVLDKWSGDIDSLAVFFRTKENANWIKLDHKFNKYAFDWTQDTIALPQKTATYQLAFQGVDRLGKGIKIDNVIVRECPDCLVPIGVTASGVEKTTATIMWGDGGIDALQYRLRVDSKPLSENVLLDPDYKSDIIDTEVDASTRFYALSDLEMGKDYFVYIQTICNTENSKYSTECKFTTKNDVLLPYVENFNSPFTGYASRMQTWYYGNSNDKFTPFINTNFTETNMGTGSRNATQSLCFSAAGATYLNAVPANEKCYAATPELVFSAGKNITDCEIEFYSLTKANATTIKIGVMTDPTDVETFELVKDLNFTKYDLFKDFVVSLEGANPNAKHVAFMLDSKDAVYFVIEDLTIREIPSCAKARDIDFLKIDPNAITIDWDKMGATEGEIMITSAPITDFSKDYSSLVVKTVSATSFPFTVTDLTAWTQYYFYARNKCGTKYGEWSAPFVVRTPDVTPAEGIMYSFDKSSATDYSPDPTTTSSKLSKGILMFTNCGVIPYLQDTYVFGSTYFMLGRTDIPDGKYSMAVFPQLENVQNTRVVLSAYGYKSPAAIEVGVIEKINDIETFTVLERIEMTSTFTRYVVDLDSYKGTGKYLAMKFLGQTTRIDYVEIKPIPTCLDPKNVVVTPTTTDATISWEANGATSWKVRVSETDNYTGLTSATGATWILDEIVTNPTINVPTLVSNGKRYYYYIQSICGEGNNGEWTNSRFFQTECTLLNQFPHTENFVLAVQNGTYSDYPCYTFHGDVSYYKNNATANLKINSSTNSVNSSYIVFPNVDIDDISTMQLNVNIGNKRFDGNNDYIEYGVMTDPNDINTFVLCGKVPCVSYDSRNTTMVELFFSKYTGSGKYIALRTVPGVPVQYEINDYILKAKEGCPVVKDLTSSDITASTAKLSWTGDLESSWDVVVANRRLSIDELDSAVTSGATTDFVVYVGVVGDDEVTVNNLKQNVFHFFYVRAKCTALNSAWSEPATFRTSCGVLSLAEMRVETFENYNGGEKPACWTCDNTEASVFTSTTRAYTDPAISTSNANSGTNSLCLRAISHDARNFDNSMYAVSPEIDTDDISKLKISFWGYAPRIVGGNNYQGQLNVGIVTDLEDVSTFVLIETIDNFQSGYQYTIPFSKYTSDMNGNKGRYVMFTTNFPMNNEFYIDDVKFSTISSCEAPAYVNVDEILCEGVKVSWAKGTSPYIIKLSKGKQLSDAELNSSAAIEDVTVVNNHTTENYEFTGLDRRTTYYLYVGSICGPDTLWSNIRGFETACETAYPLPYLTTFDEKDRTGRYSQPDCWISFYGEERIWYQRNTIENGGYEGKALKMEVGSVSFTSYAVMPKVANPIKETLISFYANMGAGMLKQNVVVGVVTDITNRETIKATFTPVDTVFMTEPGFRKYYSSLKNYKGKDGYIAFSSLFRYNIGTSTVPTSGTFMFDNVLAETLPNCMFPDNLKVEDVAPDYINISFDELADATAWEVACVAAGTEIDEANVLSATSTKYSIKNLSPKTAYDIYVRSACDATSKSPWIGPVYQTTATNAVTIYTYNEDFNSSSDWYMLSNAQSNKWVVGNVATSNNSLFISNDNGSTANYNPAEASSLIAYRTLYLAPGVYDISFDTTRLAGKAVGSLNTGIISSKAMFIDGTDSIKYADATKSILKNKLTKLSGEGNVDNKVSGYVTITNEMAGYYYLVFNWTNSAQNGVSPELSLAIDNIQIAQSSCVQPLNVSIARTTSADADVSWEIVGDATEYKEWQIVVTNDINLTPDNAITSGAVFVGTSKKIETTVNQLAELTTYYVYVRAKCALDDSYTTWSQKGQFKTPCNPIAVGTVYDFEEANINAINCITLGNTVQPGSVSTFKVMPNASNLAYSKSGTKALFIESRYGNSYSIHGTYLSLPHIEGSLDNVQLTFWMRPIRHNITDGKVSLHNGQKLENSAATIVVSAMTNLKDTSTYTQISECVYPYTDDDLVNNTTLVSNDPMGNDYWVKYSVPLKGFDGQYILLHDLNPKAISQNNLYIDSLTVEAMPTCVAPRDVIVSNITDNAVDVSFAHVDGTKWEYKYSKDPRMSNAITGVIQSDRFNINGLDQATTYYVRVRQVCSTSDNSDWSMNTKFTTSYSVRYEERFTPVRVTPVEWSMANSPVIDEHFELGSPIRKGTSGWAYREISDFASSHQVITLASNKTTSIHYLITPNIYLEADQKAYVSFDAAITNAGTYDPLPENVKRSGNLFMLLISLDGGKTWKREDAHIWNATEGNTDAPTFYDFSSKFKSIRVELDKYSGRNINLAFYVQEGGPVDIDFHIDNLYINSYENIPVEDAVCETMDYVHEESGIRIPSSKLRTQSSNHFEVYKMSETGNSDKLYVFDLTVNPLAIEEINADICANETYTDNGFGGKAVSGIYKRKIGNGGCDSIAVLNLTVNPLLKGEFEASFCPEGSYMWNGKEYKVAGSYLDTVDVIGACDSIITLHLSTRQTKTAEKHHAICEGESITIDGETIVSDGSFNIMEVDETTMSSDGCDSVTTHYIKQAGTYNIVYEGAVCEGETYDKHGFAVATERSYSLPKVSADGCDSIVNLNLIVIKDGENNRSVTRNINTKQLPYDFYGKIFDINTKEGSYTGTVTVNAESGNCSMTVSYSINIGKTVGTEDVYFGNVCILTPNPANIGEEVIVTNSFTEEEMKGMVVNVYTVSGARIDSFYPSSNVIKISNLNNSGIYVVRIIDGNGFTHIGKIVVK